MKATMQQVLLCAYTILALPGVNAQVPLLNSFPPAIETIYLDFDGQYVTGTSWNWSGAIVAQPASLSDHSITEVFNRVSEDYRPFNLNVTTDSSIYLAAPINKRTRVIITTSWQWYGRAGGVAFIGTFRSGDDTPAWVFSDLLGYRSKYIAEACSHEAGHTLGLQHQSEYSESCNRISEYNEGKGEGEIGWAPIMGVSYYKNNTTWHTGPTPAGCHQVQNDLQTISSTNNISFRTDDHADNPAEASPIDISAYQFFVNGLINQGGDADVFKFQVHTPANLRLTAVPQNVGLGNLGANIDIKVVILNAAKDTIGIYNPSNFLNAGIDTNLNSGDYYIIIQPTGNVNHSDYGSLGYYFLDGELDVLLPVHQFTLKGTSTTGNHVLRWNYTSDEPVKHVIIEGSPDGNKFHTLATLPPEVNTFYISGAKRYEFYRLKAVAVLREMPYYSNVINIITRHTNSPVRILTNPVRNEIIVAAEAACDYKLFASNGRLLYAGKLNAGINRIDISNTASGPVYLQSGYGTNKWMQVLIKQ